MIALLYPWIITLLVVLAIGVAIWKKFWICGCLLLAAFVLNWYSECVTVSFPDWGEDESPTLRVMTWNIDGSEYDSLRVEGIVRVISEQNPDVVFLAEDFTKTGRALDSLLIPSYAYKTTRFDDGHIFYSKLPLDSVRGIDVEGYGLPLRVHAQIVKDGKVIDLYGCHLASNNYSPDQTDFHIEEVEDSHDAKKYFLNIEAASDVRVREAQAIVEDNRQHGSGRAIIMGDMNDVCGSPALNVFESAGFEDAWWKGGFGYGATIHHPLPYRIDHIMYTPEVVSKGSNGFQKVSGLRLKSIKKIDADGLSDHDALVAEFAIE